MRTFKEVWYNHKDVPKEASKLPEVGNLDFKIYLLILVDLQGYSQSLARFDRGWLRLSLGYFQKTNALQSILAYSSTLFGNFCAHQIIFFIQITNKHQPKNFLLKHSLTSKQPHFTVLTIVNNPVVLKKCKEVGYAIFWKSLPIQRQNKHQAEFRITRYAVRSFQP